MQTHLRPKSLKLRKAPQPPARWFTRWGHYGLVYNYGLDVGNLHILDYWLHHATKDLISLRAPAFHDSRIGRYLDGEEEREGTYR
jgi:hypothetical protein